MRLSFRPGIRFLQIYFLIGIVILGGFWFLYTRGLFARLEEETQTRTRIFARYMEKAAVQEDSTELPIIFQEVIRKIDFPVVVTDAQGNPSAFRNVGAEYPTPAYLRAVARRLDREHPPIPVYAAVDSQTMLLSQIHYGVSRSAQLFRLFPFIQLIFLLCFIALGVWGLLVYRRGEEEHIWTSLAKETAHQLGTPLSSLSGWLSVIRTRRDPAAIEEMAEDLRRMRDVLERFSRIGRGPATKPQPLVPILERAVGFMARRASRSVQFETRFEVAPVVDVDEVLFAWTLENLIRNALDAIGTGRGTIRVTTSRAPDGRAVQVAVADTGGGITISRRDIFKPGVTTKTYGWGVGLALARRIVAQYHRGRLWLAESNPRQTIFIIQLPVVT